MAVTVRKSQQLQSKDPVGTDWEQIIDQVDKKSIPTFLIREVHFIYPGVPDIVMGLSQLDAETLELLGDTIQNSSAESDNRIRLVIDARKLQQHIEPWVDQMLHLLP